MVVGRLLAAEALVRFVAGTLSDSSEVNLEMMESEGFVRVKQAAAILDVAPNTVRAWGAAGKITEYRHPANNYRLLQTD